LGGGEKKEERLAPKEEKNKENELWNLVKEREGFLKLCNLFFSELFDLQEERKKTK
jgi:hypothetical protein